MKGKLKPVSDPRPVWHGEFFKQQYWVRNQDNHNVYLTQRNCNVHSKNCVYLIRCKQCGIQYVVQTGNTILIPGLHYIGITFVERKAHIPLVNHFIEHDWAQLTHQKIIMK